MLVCEANLSAFHSDLDPVGSLFGIYLACPSYPPFEKTPCLRRLGVVDAIASVTDKHTTSTSATYNGLKAGLTTGKYVLYSKIGEAMRTPSFEIGGVVAALALSLEEEQAPQHLEPCLPSKIFSAKALYLVL